MTEKKSDADNAELLSQLKPMLLEMFADLKKELSVELSEEIQQQIYRLRLEMKEFREEVYESVDNYRELQIAAGASRFHMGNSWHGSGYRPVEQTMVSTGENSATIIPDLKRKPGL